MADTKLEAYGNIVAFEGHPDVVSTQLRLLPTSPQILILPAVQCYIASDDSDKAFEVRAYIRKVHDALITRQEAARSFLHGATTSNKRLAFLNGGSPSAHALCIKAIMKHETGGDRVEAEAVYAQLAKGGLAGLEAKSQIHSRTGSVGGESMFNEELHDPITRAMRAADALDRDTANLQPSDMLELTMTTRPRSLSLPLYGYSDGFGDAAPFFLFGAQVEDEVDVEDSSPLAPGAPTFAVVDYNQPAKRPISVELAPASPSGAGKSKVQSNLGVHRETEMLSPIAPIFNARTRDTVTSGESTTSDIRTSVSSSKGTLQRVRSLDRIYPISAKLRDLCITGASQEMGEGSRVFPRSRSFMVVGEERPPAIRRLSYIDRRTALSKGRRPTVKVEQTSLDKKTTQGPNFGGVSQFHLGADIATTPDVPFQPILPWVENLVVHFRDETPNLLLSSVIKSFKAGNYPILSSSTSASVYSGNVSTPTTLLHQPTTFDERAHERFHDISGLGIVNDDFVFNTRLQPRPARERTVPSVNVIRPPTPAQTPPPCTGMSAKFHEFDIISGKTAVAIQNSLRSVLSLYFPPEAEGYRQFQFSLLPEFDGLWKPVFRETEPKGSPRGTNRRVDHILAIGSQQGVDKVYSSGIIKQLETIGTKSSDRQGRSGRVDFRYLLANAMQAFTALPLTNQTSDNPFANSYLLATLLIPHLETYLALHSEIRYLLLEYPPEHLATVLALQKLIGVDLIKVAQIVDPNNKDCLPFTQIGGPNVGTKINTKTPNLSPQSSSSDITVSNANFLLTCTATSKDIAKFVSAVWNIQIETCDPEPSPKRKSLPGKKPRPAPLDVLLTKFPRSSLSTRSGPSPTSAEPTSSPESLTLSSRRQSFTDNIKTPKSETIYSRAFSRRRLFRSDSASMTTFDHSSDDSELDLEERRLMPMFMKTIEPKGNTRKALKFLGLA